jgi:hypothetical protein
MQRLRGSSASGLFKKPYDALKLSAEDGFTLTRLAKESIRRPWKSKSVRFSSGSRLLNADHS